MAAAYTAQQQQRMSYADQVAMNQATYVARVHRRAMPPRCSPVAILVLVLSAGMMFIGITMTLIAHWPGATSIGENPLRIAGPVLLGVGFLGVVKGIVLTYFLNKREREKWDRNLGLMVRENLSKSGENGPRTSMERGSDQPIRSILRSSSGQESSNEYGYSAKSIGDSDFHADKPRYRSSGVEDLPDPRGRRQRKGRAGSADGADDDPNELPDPMRVTKKRRPREKGGADVSGSSGASLSVGEADLGLPGVASPQHVYTNVSFERDTPVERRSADEGPRQQHRAEDEKRRERSSDERQRRRRDGTAKTALLGQQTEPRGPLTRNAALEQQQLRVHIKAKPGTAVHITPSQTPTRGGAAPPYSYSHPSQAGESSETEI